MRVILSPRAEKELRRLPKFDQIAIAQKIRSFSQKTISGEEKLSGFLHIYRVRIGNYRMVYRKTSGSIHIVLIHHRRDVYRILKEILK